MKVALTAVCALAATCAVSASGLASGTLLPAPTGLHGFVSTADEPTPANPSYAQLPAFAWAPVSGAQHYEIQLATSVTFAESTVLLDDPSIQTPVTSLQMQVPWMTGRPFALWVRVRSTAGSRVSRWSKPFGFNTSWQDLPRQLPAPAGLLRWTPVGGATAYEVWLKDVGVRFRTLTNVADEREYWSVGTQVVGPVQWRVRALRYVKNAKLPNKVQVVTYGPYSPIFTSSAPNPMTADPLAGTDAISDVDSTPADPRPNALMPGFAWSGTLGTMGVGDGHWRVYVFSDRGCVNSVTVGSLVDGPAWAPRWTPPTAPALASEMADYTKIVTAEEGIAAASGSGGSSPSAPTSSGSGSDSSFITDPGAIALPDNGWPAGRYWWTVVPVRVVPGTGTSVIYRDLELPQDACAAGRVWSFGMESMPVTTQLGVPRASGLDGGRVTSAAAQKPAFVQLPVITWTPVLGAQSYEIQLSRRLYPWKAAKQQTAVVPSVILKLSKQDVGLWYYRVRGVNGNLPGTSIKMTWSKPTAVRISGDKFVVVKK